MEFKSRQGIGYKECNLKTTMEWIKGRIAKSRDIEFIFSCVVKNSTVRAIKEKEKLLGIKFTEESIIELILHIGIVAKRVKEGNTIECLSDFKDDIKNSKYYKDYKRKFKNN